MAVISSLQAGLQVNSTGNTQNTGQISFSDANGFFPIYDGATTTTGTGKLMTGGVFLTINPSAGVAGSVATLIKGEAATLSIEYNMANSAQFRFTLTPLGSTTIFSQWLSVGSEHSVGVSYDTTSGVTILSADGSAHTTVANYAITSKTAFNQHTVFASNAMGANDLTTTPTYNGVIDQVTTFNSAPSAALLNTLTADPVGAASSMSTHLETQTVALASVNTGISFTHASTASTAIPQVIYGIAIDDVVTDSTHPSYLAANTKVSSIAADGTITLSSNVIGGLDALGAPIDPPTTDVFVFTHSTSVSKSVKLPIDSPLSVLTGISTGIQAGDFVTGFDIPANTKVVQVVDNAVKLSNSIGSTTTGGYENVLFTHVASTANVTSTGATLNDANTIYVNSLAGIQIGDIAISGANNANVPAMDHVIGFDKSTGIVTLEMPTIETTPGQYDVTFVHSSAANAPGVSGSGASIVVGSVAGNIQVGDIVTDTVTADIGFTKNLVVTNVSGPYDTLSGPRTNVTLSGAPPSTVGTDALTFTHTTSTSTTGSAAALSSVLTLNSGSGVQVGDIVVDVTNNANVYGTGAGLTVSQIKGNSVTLSGTVPNAFTGDTLSFVHPPATTSSSPAYTVVPPATSGTTTTVLGYQLAADLTQQGTTKLYLNSTNGILANDWVTGPNIPAGDYVASVTDGDSLVLNSGTTLTDPVGSKFTFTHPTNSNVQVVTISTNATGTVSYHAGNTITITANVNANTQASATYTVATGDLDPTSIANTETNIATSFVNANPSIGAFNLIVGKAAGTINLVPQTGTAQVLPLATVTESNSVGINENTIADFYNFSNITTAASTTTGANGGIANTYDSSGLNYTTVASTSYAGALVSLATPQAHGPIYAELSSLNDKTAIYNLFVDGSMVSNGVLNSAGLTINVPTTQATINSITPSAAGTISQVNNLGHGSISYQWASNAGVKDFTQPIGQISLSLNSTAINTVSATVTNMSVNSKNFMDPIQSVPMLETSTLNSQVYSVSGHIFDQFNPNGAYGISSDGTAWAQYTTQVALPNNDFSYTVAGSATSDLTLSVEQANLSPVTQAAHNAAIALDLVASSMPAAWSTAKAMPFTVTIDVPSNATGVTFTPTSGVTLTSSASTVGHTLTLSGTYTAPGGKGAVATSTPTLGTLNATLMNEFNNGGQFSMDTVTINGNAATGQSLYFGMGETDANGAYSLANLPVGSVSIKPFNNVSQVNPSSITVDDVLAVMTIAAGKGVPAGLGQVIGDSKNLLPSDYVAADFNLDGQVTAADALSMLNYIVSVNKSAAPAYVYMSASGNALVNTAETATAVVAPALTAVPTNLSPANAVLIAGTNKVIDIIGVLPGNVVSY
jgi:hypothetical protein